MLIMTSVVPKLSTPGCAERCYHAVPAASAKLAVLPHLAPIRHMPVHLFTGEVVVDHLQSATHASIEGLAGLVYNMVQQGTRLATPTSCSPRLPVGAASYLGEAWQQKHRVQDQPVKVE